MPARRETGEIPVREEERKKHTLEPGDDGREDSGVDDRGVDLSELLQGGLFHSIVVSITSEERADVGAPVTWP